EVNAGGTLSPRLRDPPPAERRQQLLRAVLPCQPRLPHRRPDSSPLPDPVLQGGLEPLSPAALPAVLHPEMSRTLRGGSDYSRDLSGSGARREAFPGRPPDRPGPLAAEAHGRSRHLAGVRAGREVSRPDL